MPLRHQRNDDDASWEFDPLSLEKDCVDAARRIPSELQKPVSKRIVNLREMSGNGDARRRRVGSRTHFPVSENRLTAVIDFSGLIDQPEVTADIPAAGEIAKAVRNADSRAFIAP
jgi:hypothetical protein